MTYQEIWELEKEFGYDREIVTHGKPPWQTLGAQLFLDVRDNPNSLFYKASERPAQFFLTLRASILNGKARKDQDPRGERFPKKDKGGFSEKDLHPLLAYFAYTNLYFNRGKVILTTENFAQL